MPQITLSEPAADMLRRRLPQLAQALDDEFAAKSIAVQPRLQRVARRDHQLVAEVIAQLNLA